MITSLFINTIYAIVYLITSPFRLLSDVTLPQNFLDSIGHASSIISPLNWVVPIDTLIDILNLFIIIELAYYTYKGIMWLIKRIPTQS